MAFPIAVVNSLLRSVGWLDTELGVWMGRCPGGLPSCLGLLLSEAQAEMLI